MNWILIQSFENKASSSRPFIVVEASMKEVDKGKSGYNLDWDKE